jgi:hypothetical protein
MEVLFEAVPEDHIQTGSLDAEAERIPVGVVGGETHVRATQSALDDDVYLLVASVSERNKETGAANCTEA